MEKHSLRVVTIGRFSAEKDHAKLIEAFELFHINHPESGLIIIGGPGPLYNKTLARIAKSSCWQDIMVIREINNPMPILKQCNVFVLSSNYESLGLVLLEAATLGVPEIAAKCPATELLMNTYKGGYLAENSVEGICEGLEAYLRGEVGTMKIDWKQYNERAVAQFESLFD
jgi:CDP-glycerol glycerophosphotransferase